MMPTAVAAACSNLLMFMLQQSTTCMSQLKTGRVKEEEEETLWGMMGGWESITPII